MSGGGYSAVSVISGGCHGGMSGGGYSVGSVISGGCYGGMPVVGHHGGGVVHGGCCGGVIIHSYGCCGGVITPEKPKPEKPGKPDGKDEEEKISSDAPARIVVKLPADAKLTVDGASTKSTSAVRTFESPVLPAGRTYSYVLEARFTKDGEEVVVSKRVEVTPGKTTDVDLNKADAVASK